MYEVGLPLYDAFWVRKKIGKLLQQDGFFVEVVNENTMMIYWDIDKLKEQEEINIAEKKIKRAHKKNMAKIAKSNKKTNHKLIKL